MDKLPAGDQPFFHGHLAPRAEAVGEIGGGRFGADGHGRHSPRGLRILSTDHSRNRPAKNFSSSSCRKRKSWYSAKYLQCFFTHTQKGGLPYERPGWFRRDDFAIECPRGFLDPPCTGDGWRGEGLGLCTAVDLQDCHPDLIRNADHIRRYVVELCELIDMQRFGECQVVDFGSGRVAGYSMVQLISTSLISGHFANDTNNAYLDIFSCKGYDPAVVEEFSKQFFGARRSTATVTLRY